ncbi:hypothetical protein [Solidesulfovibrio alcoholivorans]|uniref:hypothetical protein n=1 Tax=Solidesulfovibrio alcoholivorans TaxID=81406 RepID=UPI0012EC9E1E|nr:hypothetical protein [Solidesulfovibrio alcoholivorans]
MPKGKKKDFSEGLENDSWLRSANTRDGFWTDAYGNILELHDMEYSYLLNCRKMLKKGYFSEEYSHDDNERANAIAKAKLSEIEEKIALLERELGRPIYANLSQEQKKKMTLNGVGIPD